MITNISITYQYVIGDKVLVKGYPNPFKITAIVPLDCKGAFQYHLESQSENYPDLTVSECLILKSLQ